MLGRDVSDRGAGRFLEGSFDETFGLVRGGGRLDGANETFGLESATGGGGEKI